MSYPEVTNQSSQTMHSPNSSDMINIQYSGWYHATTLTERVASLRDSQSQVNDRSIDSESAIQRWRANSFLQKDSLFAESLAVSNISETELSYLLTEAIEAVSDRSSPPDWLMHLAETFAAQTDITELQDPASEQDVFGFLWVIYPLMQQGRDRIKQQIQVLAQRNSRLPFDPETIEPVLFTPLAQRLLAILNRTLVLELNVARLQGLLQGDTPQERFRNFIQRLRQPEVAIALLQEYPVLARQAAISIDQWVTFVTELLQHLCNDWGAICTTFTTSAPGMLVGLSGNVGDSHRGGKAVTICQFESGFQIVYKPKSLAISVHFQELLTWLNERGQHAPFYTLKVLDRQTYGWEEFVPIQECTSADQVHRFYQRQGSYLALLHTLEATDFHYENLIAMGEHPVPIDLEVLFHCTPKKSQSAEHATHLAHQALYQSVLQVGLLPHRMWETEDSDGIDISGMGGMAGQLTPFEVPYWQDENTDEMRFARKQVKMIGSQNLPTFNGVVNPQDYVDDIVKGFTSVYRTLLKYRDELLSESGPLDRFAQDEVRVVLRATQTYAVLLRESCHPDLLRNALERERLLNQLWNHAEWLPYLAKVIPAERASLLAGDIPMFTTRTSSRTIECSSGESIPDFFERSGMELVQQRLRNMSETDLVHQVWYICSSLATLPTQTDGLPKLRYTLPPARTSVSRDRYIAAARALGDRLETLAVRGDQDVAWIGVTFSAREQWLLEPVGIDLYDGLPGIILFLAHLGAMTGEQRYTDLAETALKTLQALIPEYQPYLTSIGAFSGWGGLIYLLTQLGVLWQRSSLLEEAEALVEHLPALIAQDKLLDIIGGAAGCLACLLSLYRVQPSDRVLTAAIQCGDHLIAAAQPMAVGVGWTMPGLIEQPLTGLSHGAAGIAWVLLELAAVTGETRFQDVAVDAIAYERSQFCPEVGNWLDLRSFTAAVLQEDRAEHCMTVWCHGAPGIGLARSRSRSYLDDDTFDSEIRTALRTTLEQGFGRNHSLCHGDLGNLELVLQVSLLLDREEWQPQVDQLAASILDSMEQYGWLCGVPLGVETPGLMTGLAGIGYELLRLADPTQVPAVLTLEPPR